MKERLLTPKKKRTEKQRAHIEKCKKQMAVLFSGPKITEADLYQMDLNMRLRKMARRSGNFMAKKAER